MASTGNTKSPFLFFYGEKPKIIRLFQEFGRMSYINKQDKSKNNMTEKTYKAIMVGCAVNHTRYTYKL